MKRDYKIKFTDKSKATLWIHLDLAKVHRMKGLTSLYIISYLDFLNLNNILTVPKTLVVAEAGFGLTRIMVAYESKQMQAVYRSPCQSKDKFESFADNFNLNLDSIALRNPYLLVVLGDFNAQIKGWYPLGKWSHWNWLYYVSVWTGTTDSWTKSDYWREVFLHIFNFCFWTKFGGGIRCPIFFASKLSSPNSICKIQSPICFSTFIWTWSIAF